MKETNSIILKAGEAFGSGDHPSTQAVLAILRGLAESGQRFHNVLDMGCGSGILGLMAARLWHCPVLAVDIAPQAVNFTLDNAQANGLGPLITALRSDGYAHASIAERAKYDLILCNMLAEHIVRYANELYAYLAPGGTAILSGILVWLQGPVIEAHKAAGLELITEIPVGDWRTLVLVKPNEAAPSP